MTPKPFQLVITSEVPVFDYIDHTDKEKLLSFTNTFIRFLRELRDFSTDVHIKLAIIPVYFEILDQSVFQEEMTDYLQKRKLEYAEVYHFWRENEGKLNTVMRKMTNGNLHY